MMRRAIAFGVSACVVGLLAGCATWFAPNVDFTTSSAEGPSPLVVQFTPVCDEPIAACSWTFGDGGSSNEMEPVHIYRSKGAFTVSLTARFADGAVAKTARIDCVNVVDAPRKATPQYLYWVDWESSRRGIWRGALDGGEKELILPLEVSWPRPTSLAVGGGWIYWFDARSYCIRRARTDGTGVSALFYNQYYVTDLEIVPEANALVWITRPVGPPGRENEGGILLSFLDDREIQTLRTYASDAEWSANRLAIDADGTDIYWSTFHYEPAPRTASIKVAPTTGPFAPSNVQSEMPVPWDISIGTLAGYPTDYVYWSDIGGWIYRCRPDGTGKEQLLRAVASSLLVDRLSGKMYFVAGRGIERANLDGSEREVLYWGSHILAIALPK